MRNKLNTRELAAMLNISPDDVCIIARKGWIKCHKSGRQWRFRATDVRKFIDQHREAAETEEGGTS